MDVSSKKMRELTSAYAQQLAQMPPDTLCGRIRASFFHCDAAQKSLTYQFETCAWMANPAGMLHGGITGEAISITAGALMRYLQPKRPAALLSAQLSYPHPGVIGRRAFVTISAIQAGRSMIYLHASAWQEGQHAKPFADGTLIYEVLAGEHA